MILVNGRKCAIKGINWFGFGKRARGSMGGGEGGERGVVSLSLGSRAGRLVVRHGQQQQQQQKWLIGVKLEEPGAGEEMVCVQAGNDHPLAHPFSQPHGG